MDFAQLDLEVVNEVVAGLRSAAAAAAEQVAENIAEDVKDRFGRVEVRHAHAVEARMAVAVVDGAFFLIAEDGVGLGRFFELGRRFFVAGVAVRMILEGQTAVRLLDVVVRGLAGDAQHLVVIPLLGHEFLK